ncbi:hypothetical protein DMJ13_11700 [halophilic archaeon]|nr:hypothetical protein DMJ13_11700 [halophilic archaeon]
MSDDTTGADRAGSGESGLRTLVMLGLSFVAGYLVGRGRSGTVDLDEDLKALAPEEEPMEIEIEESDEEDEEDSEE